jgi:uncharacterized protein YbjT (DUF2867 family)
MTCITGAGGTLGSEIIRQLESARTTFRAAYFSERVAETARARGLEAVVIDYNRPETLRAAFQGCDTLFLLGPNALNQAELELNAVEAAKSVGVRHIIKQSVIGAEDDYSLAHIHRAVERAIETSGMPWTFLRPNSFMQNTVTFMAPTIRTEGAFYSASGGARISHVDVRDLAAVAIRALTEPGHEGAIYQLSGPEALSYDEMAEELSRTLGRVIRQHQPCPGGSEGRDARGGYARSDCRSDARSGAILPGESRKPRHRRCQASDRTRSAAIRRLRT